MRACGVVNVASMGRSSLLATLTRTRPMLVNRLNLMRARAHLKTRRPGTCDCPDRCCRRSAPSPGSNCHAGSGSSAAPAHSRSARMEAPSARLLVDVVTPIGSAEPARLTNAVPCCTSSVIAAVSLESLTRLPTASGTDTARPMQMNSEISRTVQAKSFGVTAHSSH